MSSFLSTLNYWAVLVSGIAFWILGAVWFSGLFGNIWAAELEKHGVKIKEPSSPELAAKMVQTFILNLLVAFGVAFVVHVSGSSEVLFAIKLGAFLGACFSFSSIGTAYTWESRSLKLLLIDSGYPFFGVIVCTIILSLWK